MTRTFLTLIAALLVLMAGQSWRLHREQPLADVLGRADDVAGEQAQALDRAHVAGVTCQQSYGALNPTK